nr:DSBA-like thioredoxin domain protein [uncultured bacterium]
MARLLEGDGDRADIAARDAHARSRGVSGVPTFIIDNRYAVQGAQPTENWLKVVDETIENMKESRDV